MIISRKRNKKLTWTKHITNLTARAGQKLGALRRVATKLDVAGKATIYKSQIRSVMEYASLCWMNASTTALGLLDSIQRKALRVIGVNEEDAQSQLNIPSLQHRRRVAAATVLYKMQTNLCPSDMKSMLPQPYVIRRSTRTSRAMPRHALTIPTSRTYSTDRSFLHIAVPLWNNLPEGTVGEINDSGVQSFKRRVHQHLLFIDGVT